MCKSVRVMRAFVVSVLLVGTLAGISPRAWADRVEAIAIISRTEPWSEPRPDSPDSCAPVLILLAAWHEGRWVPSEELQRNAAGKRWSEDGPPLREDIYDALRGRSFVPANGDEGRYEATDGRHSYHTGNVYVVGCNASRPIAKGEQTVVVTRRLNFAKPNLPLPGRSTFLSFARRAIGRAETKDHEVVPEPFQTSLPETDPSLPLRSEELKAVALPYGGALYWVLVTKTYGAITPASSNGLYPYTYSYYALCSGSLPGHWRIAWESVSSKDGNGKGSRLFEAPIAICDVNRDSNPELVLPEEEYEGSGWRTFELRKGRLAEIGAIMTGY